MNIEHQNKYSNQRGSALVYILIAIALLAALTSSFMKPSSQQTTSQSTFNTVTELNSQANFIRSAVQECVLTYPAGEDGLVGTTNTPYPINPSSTHLLTPALNDQARHIRCPGNPGGSSNDHSQIFSGASGKFMPPSPNLFEEWEYFNGSDGVFFYIATDKSDAFLQTAMQKIDDQFSECEADIVDATGGNIELTSTAGASDPKCLEGFVCMRVWLVTKNSAVYNGDAGGDEAACP